MSITWETNRYKKTKPKTGKFWCNACDAAYMSANSKCSNCGISHKLNSKH